jgi:hypothetical protein
MFSLRSVSYQKKAGDYFFPELLVMFYKNPGGGFIDSPTPFLVPTGYVRVLK